MSSKVRDNRKAAGVPFSVVEPKDWFMANATLYYTMGGPGPLKAVNFPSGQVVMVNSLLAATVEIVDVELVVTTKG